MDKPESETGVPVIKKDNTGFYVGYECGYGAGGRDMFRACFGGLIVAVFVYSILSLFKELPNV